MLCAQRKVRLVIFLSGCEYSCNSGKECLHWNWNYCARSLSEHGLVEGKPTEDVFKGLGDPHRNHHVNIDDTFPPVIHPLRKVPVALRDKIKTELLIMEQLRSFAMQNEPTDWVHNLIKVRKPSKIRLCIAQRI